MHRHLCALMLLCCCAACAPQPKIGTHVVSGASLERICRVAVLPFGNDSRQSEAGLVMSRIFLGELVASDAFTTEAEGEVRLFMQRNRLLPGEPLSPPQYNDLARRMQVDAVVRGRITDLGLKQQSGEAPVPYLDLQVEVASARTGDLVLNTYHRRGGDDYRKAMHFGTVRTTSGLMAAAAREIITDWKERGMGQCQ